MKMPRGEGHPLVEAQMISLADIACLLIFFFMYTSTLVQDRIQVKLPDLPKTARTESHLTVVMDANGVIQYGSAIVTNAKELENMIKGDLYGKTKPEDLEVRFKGDRRLKFKDYSPVYEAISAAGGVIAVMHDIRK